jgi:hypothetical protein
MFTCKSFFCAVFGLTHSSGGTKCYLQNLEFIADREAKKLSDKSVSAYTLKITTHENCCYHYQSFYQSLIKKRIVMLNKKSKNEILEVCNIFLFRLLHLCFISGK